MHTLDHLMCEALTLEAGEARFAEATGVKPVYGGKHPHAGTHNSLLSLGGAVYLEIIALDPEHPGTAELLQSAPADFTPKLVSFGVKATDLDRLERLVTRCGLTVAERLGVSRQTPSGEVWYWETLIIDGHAFGSCIPFFTRSHNALHTSETLHKGCELLEFTVGHPNAETLLDIYSVLELDVPVIQNEHPHLRAVLRTPKGLVSLDNLTGIQSSPS